MNTIRRKAGRSPRAWRPPRRSSSIAGRFSQASARSAPLWPGRAGRGPTKPTRPPRSIPLSAMRPYTLDRDVTPEKYNLNYNNFYEFSTSKHIDASALKTRPWTIKLDGLVEKEQTVDIDALIKTMGLEERLYRHRCVEAWSMAIPWTGFPLRKLVDFARPLSSASYVRFETFLDKKMAPGQRSFMPWPYIEGLTMAEAANDLAFIATGRLRQAARQGSGRADPAGDAVEIRLQIRQVDRAHFSSSTSGRRRSGRRWGRTNTASGPTSIRRSRIRAGARRRKPSSTTASCGRRSSTTATPSRSPRSTRGSRKSRSTCETAQLALLAPQYRQRWAVRTRKSRKAWTRATFLISSAYTRKQSISGMSACGSSRTSPELGATHIVGQHGDADPVFHRARHRAEVVDRDLRGRADSSDPGRE